MGTSEDSRNDKLFNVCVCVSIGTMNGNAEKAVQDTGKGSEQQPQRSATRRSQQQRDEFLEWREDSQSRGLDGRSGYRMSGERDWELAEEERLYEQFWFGKNQSDRF